jgi:hypothetical protein
MASDPSFHKRFGHRAERFSNEESRFANVMSALSVWGLAGSTLMIILWIVAGGYVLSPIPWPPPGWTVLAAVAFGGLVKKCVNELRRQPSRPWPGSASHVLR